MPLASIVISTGAPAAAAGIALKDMVPILAALLALAGTIGSLLWNGSRSRIERKEERDGESQTLEHALFTEMRTLVLVVIAVRENLFSLAERGNVPVAFEKEYFGVYRLDPPIIYLSITKDIGKVSNAFSIAIAVFYTLYGDAKNKIPLILEHDPSPVPDRVMAAIIFLDAILDAVMDFVAAREPALHKQMQEAQEAAAKRKTALQEQLRKEAEAAAATEAAAAAEPAKATRSRGKPAAAAAKAGAAGTAKARRPRRKPVGAPAA